MPDLTDELLRIAADGADRARPLALAEVMRKGNRRRARVIGQRSLGGLSVLGVGAAVVMAGVFHPAHSPSTAATSSTGNGGVTLTQTRQSAAGTMTVTVKYRAAPDKIKPLAITVSGQSKALSKHAVIGLAVIIGPDSAGFPRRPSCSRTTVLDSVLFVRVSKDGSFTGSVSRNTVNDITRTDGSCGVTLRVGLDKPQAHTLPRDRLIIAEGLILTS